MLFSDKCWASGRFVTLEKAAMGPLSQIVLHGRTQGTARVGTSDGKGGYYVDLLVSNRNLFCADKARYTYICRGGYWICPVSLPFGRALTLSCGPSARPTEFGIETAGRTYFCRPGESCTFRGGWRHQSALLIVACGQDALIESLLEESQVQLECGACATPYLPAKSRIVRLPLAKPLGQMQKMALEEPIEAYEGRTHLAVFEDLPARIDVIYRRVRQ